MHFFSILILTYIKAKFEYVCFIDKGKNDFKQHIKELEKLVKEL